MFRITKQPRGWTVEVETSKWNLFGIKKFWKPYIKTSGMDCAWHHRTKEMALMNLVNQVKIDLLE